MKPHQTALTVPSGTWKKLHPDCKYHFLYALSDCALGNINVAAIETTKTGIWRLQLDLVIKPALDPKYKKQFDAEIYIRPAAQMASREPSHAAKKKATHD